MTLNDGMTMAPSAFGPEETMARLVAAIASKGLTLFARIDHAAGAAAAGLALRPTTLFIFGAAKGGTPLMQQAQTLGLDLPLRALVFQDETGKTQLIYADPAELVRRHGLDPATLPAVAALTHVLQDLARSATSPA
jgi:uncharacterized protein (DUF302 family)